jgi:four helix bundle protein
MRNDKDNIIINLTFQFALDIIEFTETIKLNKKYLLADQLFKSGTSIGANVREAQNGESKADFIYKLKIAAKEADETQYWLQLCKESKHYLSNEKLLADVESIIKVLSKIISSSKTKLSNHQIDQSSN